MRLHRWGLVLVLTGLYSRIFQTREMLNCAVASRNTTVAQLCCLVKTYSLTSWFSHSWGQSWTGHFPKPQPLASGFPIPTGGLFPDPQGYVQPWLMLAPVHSTLSPLYTSTPISPPSPLWCICFLLCTQVPPYLPPLLFDAYACSCGGLHVIVCACVCTAVHVEFRDWHEESLISFGFETRFLTEPWCLWCS